MSLTKQTAPVSVAVVDRHADQIVIWHVDIGPDLGLPRLSGAWIVEVGEVDKIDNLTAGRPSISPPDSTWPGAHEGGLDLEAMVHAARADVFVVDELFTAHQMTTKNKLVRPQWPVMEHPEDSAPLQFATREIVRPALTLARGLRTLAEAWSAYESLRLQREYLVDHGGPTARALPVVLR